MMSHKLYSGAKVNKVHNNGEAGQEARNRFEVNPYLSYTLFR